MCSTMTAIYADMPQYDGGCAYVIYNDENVDSTAMKIRVPLPLLLFSRSAMSRLHLGSCMFCV